MELNLILLFLQQIVHFQFPLTLDEGTNSIVAVSDTINSNTLKFTLGYNIEPEVYAYATVSGNDVSLHASVIENPDTSILSFKWIEDSKNPISITISNSTDTSASFTMSQNAPSGRILF